MEQSNNKVCCMCFYTFRELYSLGKTKTVLTTLLGQRSKYYAENMRNKAAVACWECHRVLRKLHQFVETVNGNQETLIKAVMNLKLSKLPTLSTSSEVVIDTTQQIFEEASENEEMSCEETDEEETNSEALQVKQDIAVEEISQASDNEETSCEETEKNETKETNSEAIKVKQVIAEEENSQTSDSEEMSCEETEKDETNSEAIKVKEVIAVEEISQRSDSEEMSCEETEKNKTNSEAIKVKEVIAVEKISQRSDSEETEKNKTNTETIKVNQVIAVEEISKDIEIQTSLLNPSSKSLPKPTSQSILKSILSNPIVPSTSFSKSDGCTSYRTDLFATKIEYYRSKEKYDLVIFSEREMYQERLEMLDRLKLAQHVCKKCLKDFSSEELFAEHINSEHKEHPDTVMCEICETYVPNTKPRLASHKRSHYVRYRCDVCAILCDSSYRLNNHLTQHSKRKFHLCKKYRCTVCHRTFDESGNCDRHKAKVLLENAQCNVCFKYFQTAFQCRNHMRTHTVLESLQCKVCLNWFKGDFNLMTHMKRHEKKDTEIHYCQECAVTFTTRLGLRYHFKNTKKHNQNDELRLKFICNLCDRKFATNRAMKDHYKAIHFGNYYQCDICGKKLLKKWEIRKHMMLTHLRIQRKRDCICEKCGKGFFNKDLLRVHMLVHSEDRTIKCPYCVATFKQTASQFNHIRLVHLKMKRNRSKPKKKQTVAAAVDNTTAIEKKKGRSTSTLGKK